ncbi:MAG: hypothetical protein WA667_22530 [Candidatus Nitrosopolaris sp.]
MSTISVWIISDLLCHPLTIKIIHGDNFRSSGTNGNMGEPYLYPDTQAIILG